MPCLKYDAATEIIEDDDLESIGYDCDGLPYIRPDEYNLLVDPTQKVWYRQVDDHIMKMWKDMQAHIKDNELALLEKCTFADFVVFISRYSMKIAFNCDPEPVY